MHFQDFPTAHRKISDFEAAIARYEAALRAPAEPQEVSPRHEWRSEHRSEAPGPRASSPSRQTCTLNIAPLDQMMWAGPSAIRNTAITHPQGGLLTAQIAGK